MLTVLSAMQLIISFYLYREIKPTKIMMGTFFIMAFSAIILFIAYGTADYFSGDGIDEATIYHLKYGLKGAGFAEYSDLILASLAAFLLSATFLFWLTLKLKKENPFSRKNNRLLLYFLLTSLWLNPATIDLYKLQKSNVQKTTVDLKPFAEHYKKPYIKAIGNQQKNIVFIYAESLEQNYFDESLFPGLMKGLQALKPKSTYFTNIKQVAGTGWTVAGMTASQCGIPLFTPSHGNSMSGMDQFLSSATCLGDLLKEKEYQLNYIGGAKVNFAGKGKFYKTHGFNDVLGLKELLPKLEDPSYKHAWGLYDDSLLDIVYQRFIKLSKADAKFGLFTLTSGTHHPKGHIAKSCKGTQYQDGANPMLNAVSCSDHLLSRFINKIIQSPYADKTIIVLMSDHLSMRNTATPFLTKKPRNNLFAIIDPSKNTSTNITTAGSTLDIAPTLLPIIGYEGNIGLGRNLLDNQNPEKDRLFIHSHLRKWKQPISAFWNFPKIQYGLTININKRAINIDQRQFKIPILIELNKALETTLKFQFDTHSNSKQKLTIHRDNLDKNNFFLYIEKCQNVKNLNNKSFDHLGENGFCFFAGQGNKYTKATRLDKSVTYTADDILKLLKII
ncbi:Phosphoglycerol transferase I [hydrothermal vent metagenome]|uniref:Phosphoglycerol transferase I n=1 Tax=hydrothermal vent metagenome TaxID=652676 RepID=A0A3B0WBW1_9ZZZZ